MLYIKFKINDPAKFADFRKLYDHMVMVREADYVFEEDQEIEIDWENLSEEEASEALQKLYDPPNFEEMRYLDLVPIYARQFLASYVNFDRERTGSLSFSELNIFNYLEYSFEVNMDELLTVHAEEGVVRFSTLNFPFGGIERFLMTLRAYELTPFECYDGFTVSTLNWTSDFINESIEQPAATKAYLASLNAK